MKSFRLPVIAFLLAGGCSFQKPSDRVREYSRNEPGFVILTTTTQFARVRAEDSRNWQARAELKMQVCLGRTFGWRQLEPGIQFEIELADTPAGTGRAKVYTTLPDGCIDFASSIPFNFAEANTKFLKKHLIVRGRRAELAGLTRTRAIYLDPWNKTDLSDWSEAENGFPVAAQSGPLQLRVQQLSFAKLKSREIVVDDNLRLSFRYNYVLSYLNQYARLRELNATPVSTSVWPGTRFNIQGIIVAPNGAPGEAGPEDLTKYQRLAGFKTTATEDSNGQVSAEVSLQVDLADVPLLDGRPRLLLDIQPISETSGAPEAAALVVSFDPRIEQVSYTPQASPVTVQSLLGDSGQLTLKTATHQPGLGLWVKTTSPVVSSLANVGEKFGLKGPVQIWQAGQPFVIPVAEGVIETAIRGTEPPLALLKHFDFLFKHSPQAFPGVAVPADPQLQFLAAPELYATWHRFTFVGSVNPRPLEVRSGSEVLGVTANILKQTVMSNVSGMGERNVSGSEITDFRSVGFNAFGNGRTLNWIFQGRNEKYKMREISATKASIDQSGLTRVTNFYADRLSVALSGQFRDCLMITLATAERPNFLFCIPRTEPLRESYYFITDQFQTNSFSFTDARSLQERQLANIIRGERAFGSFSGLLRNDRLALKIEPTIGTGCDCALDGISNLQSSAVPVVATERLRTLSAGLSATFEEHPILNPEGLFVYFNRAMSEPEKLLGNPQGLAGFERFGDLILSRGKKSRAVYFEILHLLHSSFKARGLTQAEDVIQQLAQRKSQR